MVQNDVAKSPRVAEQCDVNIHSLNHPKQSRYILATDLLILNLDQVTRTANELAVHSSNFIYTRALGDGPPNFEPWSSDVDDTPLLTAPQHQREDVSALDRFNMYRCPTRRVFSRTGLEIMTCLP
ncbi:hypothetical protein TNCV_4414551 [Trichonephila clavipes]|uniref:Uncharacterized protein n=1 Tax=Trichonephila clavipes TaxID=2585209 RepID=A0A8X6RYR1_TRICX|nr:hypothetical protein TNCV_4414551 [Trichonephila clavipes]